MAEPKASAGVVAAGKLALSALFVVFVCLLGALGGAFAGWVVSWVVSWVFNDTMLAVMAAVGIHGIALWQWGAFLGFSGGFIRSQVSK